MTNTDIAQLAEKYRTKAMRAYDAYQGTGNTRYRNEYYRWDEIASALDIALAAEGDHTKVGHLRMTLAALAKMAKRIETLPDTEKAKAMDRLRDQIISEALAEGLMYE